MARHVSIWGRLKRSARTVQLFARLAVVENHTLWHFWHHCCLVVGVVDYGATTPHRGGASSAVRAQCNYLGVWPY